MPPLSSTSHASFSNPLKIILCIFLSLSRIDVQGVRTRFGSSQWQAAQKPCTVSAPIVDQLLRVGATLIGTLPSWPLGLDPFLDAASDSEEARLEASAVNPAGPKGSSHGGGEYGAAVAVSSGGVDLCIAVDEVGSALIPAACCGIYAYRPTSGVLDLEGASIGSTTLGTTCLLASDPDVLARAGRALNVPGGGNDTAGVVSKYLVAEDWFALCGEDVKRAAPAVVAAVKRWAGPEHAQGLSLCDWLFHRIPSLRAFMFDNPTTLNQNGQGAGGAGGAGSSSTGAKVDSSEVLAALAAAADAIKAWEWLHSPSGAWARRQRENFPATPSLPAGIIAGLAKASVITKQQYLAGIAVAEELSNGMRAALQEGYVFVVPTTPGPAPKRSAKDWQAKERHYRRQCEEFAALASLAGVPQVAMPMPVPTSGSNRRNSVSTTGPLSISLVTLQRRDSLLLKAAAKLGSMLAEEAKKIAADASNTITNGTSGSQQAKAPQSPGNGQPALSKESIAAGEVAKEEGNTAFKAGRYEEAVKRYSEAIQLNPRKAVYFSNRAMAHLKLGRYTAAEADCDDALELDPTLVKALLRRGSAQLAQGRVAEARADFERVLTLEPRNRQATEELARLKSSGTEEDGFSYGGF